MQQLLHAIAGLVRHATEHALSLHRMHMLHLHCSRIRGHSLALIYEDGGAWRGCIYGSLDRLPLLLRPNAQGIRHLHGAT
jgi:hypothetical protein